MNSPAGAVELAYRAYRLLPEQRAFGTKRYRRNQNPRDTAPALRQVLTHMQHERQFGWARAKTKEILLSDAASRYVDPIRSYDELRRFLAALAIFLKTIDPQGNDEMRKYTHTEGTRLSSEAIVEHAYGITREITWKSDRDKLNKLTQLTTRICSARSKWDCLAILARYYSRSGIPKPLIDCLVAKLEEMDLLSYQHLIAQTLVFYRAMQAETS